MESLIILATVMAVFGVFGYLRGVKFSWFNAALVVLSILLLNRAGNTLVRVIDLFYRVGRAMLAGGFKAISGEGEGGFAKLGDLVSNVPSLIGKDGTPTALVIIFLLIIALGFLLGTLKVFKSKASYLGLALGLLTGYVVSAYMLYKVLPEAGIQLPLPGWLLGLPSGSALPVPSGPSVTGSALAKLTGALLGLVDRGQIALLIAILIAVFVLLAVRMGNRSVKKG
jgi:hypothetical protein